MHPLEMRPIDGAPRLAEGTAPADDEAARVVEPEIEQEIAGIRRDLPLRQDRLADVIRQGRGRDLERVRRDDRLPQARHEIAGIAVGADHDLVGDDAGAVRGCRRPARAVAGERRNLAAAMDGSARRQRRPGEPAGIGERLDGAASVVDPAGVVLRRAEMPLGRSLVEKRGAGAAPGPLLGAPAHGLDGMGRVRSLDPALADTRHVHAVPVDQVEHGVRSAAYERGEVGPTVRKHGLDLIGIVFDPRDDLAAVAPGTAPSGFVRLEHERLMPRSAR